MEDEEGKVMEVEAVVEMGKEVLAAAWVEMGETGSVAVVPVAWAVLMAG